MRPARAPGRAARHRPQVRRVTHTHPAWEATTGPERGADGLPCVVAVAETGLGRVARPARTPSLPP
eukprot:6076112-Prymnesium_polylepis.1